MKKISLLFTLILSLVISAQAVSPNLIAGKWESKWRNAPSGDRSMSMKEKETYTISEDLNYEAKNEVQISIIGQPAVDVFIYVDFSGTVKAEADSLAFHIDPASIKVNFPEDEIRISGLIDPSQESMIKSQIHYNMRQMVPHLKESIKDYVYKDVVITEEKKGRKMVCVDPDAKNAKLEFTSKKK